MPRELPPTAGLPLKLSELRPGGRRDFAARAAAWLGVEALQLECSGTAALVVALTALARLSDRRKVIVPAWTCPLVALAVHRAGLVVQPCDLAPGHYDMDPQRLAEACDGDTLAVLPTHLAGRVADVAAAAAIARRHGAWVIEDAAQALGATRDGRSVGLDGDLGFFSLAVGKGLTLYEGGLLLTRDRQLRTALAEAHRAVIRPSARMEARRILELAGYTALYRPAWLPLAYGRPLRKALAAGDPVAAVGDDFGPHIPLHPVGHWRQAVGARALARLPAFLDQARERALRRAERLRALPGLTVFGDPPGARGVWPLLLLTLPSQGARDAALATLWTAGLGVSRMFIHALPDYGYLSGIVRPAELPNARDFAARSLTITNSPWLDEDGFGRICAELRRVLARA